MAIQYRPLTESFRELNRMIIEKQSWDAAAKSRQADIGLQGIMAESQLKTAHQQQQLQQYKIAEQERLNTPITLNAGQVLQGGPEQRASFMANKDWQNNLQRVLIDNSDDYELSPADMTYRHKETGKPFQITPNELKFKLPFVLGIHGTYTDTVANMNSELGALSYQMGEVDKEIKDKSNRYDPAKRVQLQEAKSMLQAKQKKLNTALEPTNLLKLYENKANEFTNLAGMASQMGADGFAKIMLQSAADSRASGRILQNSIIDSRSAAAKAAVAKAAADTLAAAKAKADADKISARKAISDAEIASDEKIAAAKLLNASKGTDSVTIYAQEDTTNPLTGKPVKKGSAMKVYPEKKGTFVSPYEKWDINDPTKDKQPLRSQIGMSQSTAISIISKNVETPGAMGMITAEQSKGKRDTGIAMVQHIAKQSGIAANDDYSQPLFIFNTVSAIEEEEYWDKTDYLKSKSDKELLKETSASTISKNNLNKRNIRDYLENQAASEFKEALRKYLPKDYPVYTPSKIRRQQATIGQ